MESAATNQGAWLTESAGALSDLHAAVLGSLGGFSPRESGSPSSCNGVVFAEAGGEVGFTFNEAAVPAGAEDSSGEESVSTQEGANITFDRRPVHQPESDERARADDHGICAGGKGDVAHNAAATCTEHAMPNAANSQDSSTAPTMPTGVTGRSSTHSDKQQDQRRARLQHLGLLLARKRQFPASRQVCYISGGRRFVGTPPYSCSWLKSILKTP